MVGALPRSQNRTSITEVIICELWTTRRELIMNEDQFWTPVNLKSGRHTRILTARNEGRGHHPRSRAWNAHGSGAGRRKGRSQERPSHQAVYRAAGDAHSDSYPA